MCNIQYTYIKFGNNILLNYVCRVLEAQAYWPDSLRACYGRRTKYGDYFNALHGSENHAEALREIHFFFPTSIYLSDLFCFFKKKNP